MNIERLASNDGAQSVNTSQPDPSKIGSPPDVAEADKRALEIVGTLETETSLKLDLQARTELQLRLSSLKLYRGQHDGSLGPQSRNAISLWQRNNGLTSSSFLTAAQQALLVKQSDPHIKNYQKARLEKRPKRQPKTPNAAKVQHTEKVPLLAPNTSRNSRVRPCPYREKRAVEWYCDTAY
jgi:peptidoglycan hydrolase-like protein with peptidoglycan-binding domain